MNFKNIGLRTLPVYGQCFPQLRGKPCHIYQKRCCFIQSMPWSDVENNRILH
jgi:hypothetical protein